MPAIVRSPRRRRRLAWLAAGLVAVGGAGALVAAVPGAPEPPPAHLRPGRTASPDEIVGPQVRLTAEMRRGINATLDRFVPAAVTRRDPALAWKLAGPRLRAGTTLRDWLRGALPVYEYSYRDDPFRGWRPHFTYRNRVAFDLLLHPSARSKEGAIAFGVEMVRRGDRWLVDYWYPVALWEAKGERPYVMGAVDYSANGGTAESTYEKPKYAEAKLHTAWLIIPLAVLVTGILAGLAFAVVNVRRSRRAAAQYASSGTGLPRFSR